MPAVDEVAVFLIFGSIYKIMSLFKTQNKTHSMLSKVYTLLSPTICI